eukprot:1076585-Heterocapsa_arctica.AAC.1
MLLYLRKALLINLSEEQLLPTYTERTYSGHLLFDLIRFHLSLSSDSSGGLLESTNLVHVGLALIQHPFFLFRRAIVHLRHVTYPERTQARATNTPRRLMFIEAPQKRSSHGARYAVARGAACEVHDQLATFSQHQ